MVDGCIGKWWIVRDRNGWGFYVCKPQWRGFLANIRSWWWLLFLIINISWLSEDGYLRAINCCSWTEISTLMFFYEFFCPRSTKCELRGCWKMGTGIVEFGNSRKKKNISMISISVWELKLVCKKCLNSGDFLSPLQSYSHQNLLRTSLEVQGWS